MAFQYYDKEGALIRRADSRDALDIFVPYDDIGWIAWSRIWPDVIYDVIELTEAEALEMQTEMVKDWSTP
jgi:hypothetical protein